MSLIGHLPGHNPSLVEPKLSRKQDSLNARFVGNWPFGFGWTLSLDTCRDIGFISSGAGVFILDLSSPAVPAKLGEIRCRSSVELLRHQDSILYIASQRDRVSGIGVWDVADPTSPTELTFIPVYHLQAIEVNGRYLYAGDQERLRVFDIQNPGRPVEVGSCGGYSGVHFISVADTLAVIAVLEGGFRVINIQNPTNPYQIGAWSPRLVVNGLAVADGYAYCVSDSGLRVVDVSDPANPYQVGSCRTLGFHSDRVVVRDSYAFVADDNAGLTIVDVRDPARPSVAANWTPPYYTVEDVELLDSFAFLPSWSGKPGLWIINVANPLAPFEAGSYRLAGWSFGVVVENGYAYLAEWDIGLRILDITNPACPEELGKFLTEYGADNVAVRETIAYLPAYDQPGGLRVLSVRDPSAPYELGFCPTRGGAHDCALRNSFAFVADGTEGLRAIDVANPSSPREVGFLDTPGYARHIEIQDSLAYVADESGGLRIVNIQDPTQLAEVGAIALQNYPVVLRVRDSLAFVGGYYGDMVIVNVRDPSAPYPVGTFRTAGPCWGVDVSGHYAYVSDWFLWGFHIVDIGDPSNPHQVGYYLTPSTTYGIAFSSPYVYVTTGWCGLHIYESLLAGLEESPPPRETAGLSALTVYPNPATSEFVVRLGNHMSSIGGQPPVLQVFDAAGSRVKREVLSAGNKREHFVSIEGLSDGVYFVGLEGLERKVKLLVTGTRTRR
ncbi:MAG: T9SS type A sorting domain-containing protein [candidate division WOR-3 bacterium]